MRLLHQANLLLVLGLVGCKTVSYLELINVECQSYSSYTIGTSYIVDIDYLSDQNCVSVGELATNTILATSPLHPCFCSNWYK